MVNETEELTRHDLEAKIVKHSWEDEGFRKEFLADPAGTFVKYLEIPAASLPKIAVHQEAAGSWHIVLPAKPAGAGDLSEVELERVAGGAWLAKTVKVAEIAGGVVGVSLSVGIDQGKKAGW
jgi:hypothetical protein